MYLAHIFNGVLRRARLDGSGLETLLAVPTAPYGMALHPPSGKMYWTEFGKIRRADADGSNVQDVLTNLGTVPALTIDSAAGKMYWTSGLGVRRANLDGSGLQIIAPVVGNHWGIGLDVVNGKVYWTDLQNQRIRRTGLSGGPVEEVVQTSPNAPYAVAVDLNGHLYWSELGTGLAGRIRFSALDGSPTVDLVEFKGTPFDIELDLEAGKLYWSALGRIQRADLNGDNAELLLVTNAASGLAITPSSASVDCQPNGVADLCDFTDGTSEDCDGNKIPDECDIAEGRLNDDNLNGVPDVCEVCGDGDCDPNESGCDCPNDCGPPPAGEFGGPACSNGRDDDCDGLHDCEDPNCATEIVCGAIPTVSQWGLIVFTLLLITSWKVVFAASRPKQQWPVG
jgi:hypothetical protein